MRPDARVRAHRRAVGLLAATLVLVGCSGGDDPDVVEGAESPTTAPDVVEVTATQTEPVPEVPVAEIEQVLTSGDESEILQLIGAPDGVDVDPEALAELTDILTGVELDEDGVAAFGEDVVTVPATLDGADWLFYLTRHDDEWRLALTEELP